MYPSSDDYWDGNWLHSPIDVRVGAFVGRIGAGLRAEELLRFRQGLEVMHQTLSGSAALVSMEEWLTLTVAIGVSGRLEVSGVAMDEPGLGNRLEFAVDGLDQSDLPAIIDGVLAIEAAYPVLGSPDTRIAITVGMCTSFGKNAVPTPTVID